MQACSQAMNTAGAAASNAGAYGVVGTATRDRNPVGARFSAPVQTDPGANAASCTIRTGSLSGG